MRSRPAAVALLLGFVLAASGCASTQKNKAERLREAIEAYNEAFRWKAYDRASLLLPRELRGPFLAAYEDDEGGLQIEDYQIRSVDVLDDTRATATVKMRYMLLPSVTVETAILVQHWAEVEGAWILESEDNSIKKLDAGAKPQDPRAKDAPPAEVDEAKTDVETFLGDGPSEGPES